MLKIRWAVFPDDTETIVSIAESWANSKAEKLQVSLLPETVCIAEWNSKPIAFASIYITNSPIVFIAYTFLRKNANRECRRGAVTEMLAFLKGSVSNIVGVRHLVVITEKNSYADSLVKRGAKFFGPPRGYSLLDMLTWE